MSTKIEEYKDITEMSYDQAIQETEKILSQLEQDELPIDSVLSQSRRVVALIAHCRSKMKEVSEEVQEILKELREEQSSSKKVADESIEVSF